MEQAKPPTKVDSMHLLVWERKPAEKPPFPNDIESQSTPDGMM
jgi:hypothetical protein